MSDATPTCSKCKTPMAPVPRSAVRLKVLASIKINITRNTHAVAEELGMSNYQTTTLLYNMQKSGLIRRVCKGLPGRRGYPPLSMFRRTTTTDVGPEDRADMNMDRTEF